MSELTEFVRSLAEPVLIRHGAEVVDIEVKRGRTQLVRVVADQPGGIDLETCAAVSRELGRMLDAEDAFEDRYTLEVTSPGLDRPLRSPMDFRRHAGKVVRVTMADGQVEGEITSVEDDAVWVAETRVPLDRVRSAKLVLPW